MGFQLRGAMPRNPSKTALLGRFAGCIGKVIKDCASVIFVGCPQVTQLVVVVFYKRGYEPVVRTGKVRGWDGKPVTHIWVEVPELGIRVETNPSQILGLPVSATVTPIEHDARRYEDGRVLENWAEFPALLLTPAGEAYFDRMSDEVLLCLAKRSKGKR